LSKRIVPRRRPRVKRDVLMRAGTIEVVKRGASHYDFRDPYHIALEMSWKGFALAFFGLDLGINIVFALLYLAKPGCIANAGRFYGCFLFQHRDAGNRGLRHDGAGDALWSRCFGD
jgi:hypothetical protein